MRESEPEFTRAGIAVRFVVIGDRKKADEFCGDLAARCIPDPKKSSYKAMGLEQYNLLKLFSDPELKARRRENKRAGFSQNWGATRLPDSAQLPAAAIVDGNGIIRWLYRGKHPGDLPPMRAMLEAALTALGPSQQ